MKNTKFADAFKAAKDKIREMDVRFVEERNPTSQYLLEVYAAIALETPYNSFDTH